MNPRKMRPCSAKQSSLSAPCIIPVVNNDDIFEKKLSYLNTRNTTTKNMATVLKMHRPR